MKFLQKDWEYSDTVIFCKSFFHFFLDKNSKNTYYYPVTKKFMGNNTFKSLIVATSMIAAWSHAEWTSNKIDDTKRAIQELIGSLDASKYGAARGVLGWDEALLTDGDISPQDAETIQLHANKLLWIAPEKAKAVLDALDGKTLEDDSVKQWQDVVGANNVGEQKTGVKKIEIKKSIPLNETKEQKAKRLAEEKQLAVIEKIFQRLNKGGFFDSNTWASTKDRWALCDIKTTRNTLQTEFTAKTATIWGSPKSTAYAKLFVKSWYAYKLTIGNITGNNQVGIKLTDPNWKLMGTVPLKIGANIIEVPDGYLDEALIEVLNTPTSPKTTIEWFLIEIENADDNIAAK